MCLLHVWDSIMFCRIFFFYFEKYFHQLVTYSTGWLKFFFYKERKEISRVSMDAVYNNNNLRITGKA